MINVGSDFSGIGAFDQALIRLKIDYNTVFACDKDKFARQSYIHNYGEPKYFPDDVYNREVPEESLDIFVTSPPCQAFSLAGKRLGKEDLRGVLFYNSHEFIQKNNPRFFIFENVKGLLSHDGGETFQEWISLLGGKSVNGTQVFFPDADSVPYHIYWTVLNAKEHNIPQNRERVFIVGIRDDEDNNFSWPKKVPLKLKLKDILEPNVDQKYFLSQKMIDGLVNSTFRQENDRLQEKEYVDTLLSRDYKSPKCVKVGFINQDTQASQVFSEEGISPTINAGTHGYALGYVEIGTLRTHKDGQGFRKIEDDVCPTIPARAREDGSGQPVIRIHSATSQGFEEATNGDSRNLSNPHSKTRRGRVGKEVAQTLDTSCNQGVLVNNEVGVVKLKRTEEAKKKRRESLKQGKDSGSMSDRQYEVVNQENSDTILASPNPVKDGLICIPVLTPDRLEKRQNGRRFKNDGDEMFTLTSQDRHGVYDGYSIRRLTPRECLRLMDFPDTMVLPVSDSQAYKQCGNSICVGKLVLIIEDLVNNCNLMK